MADSVRYLGKQILKLLIRILVGLINFSFCGSSKIFDCYLVLEFGILTYTAGMSRKKNKPAEKDSIASAECKDMNNSNRHVSVEEKLDKLIDTMASMEGRIRKQEDRSRIRDLSPVPSAHSSVRDPKLPSFEELKSDDKIQMELQKRLHQYNYTSRNEAKGKLSDAFKSGIFRPGVHKVKKLVNWPQDYCTVASGGRQPTYDDLNVNQWVQGIIQCAVEENNEVVKQNMLKHFVSLMQDCIKLSFPTARRAHGMIFQEMEKGNVDLTQTEKLKKIEVVTPMWFKPRVRVVIKLCCANCTTKVHVDSKSKLSTVTKV